MRRPSYSHFWASYTIVSLPTVAHFFLRHQLCEFWEPLSAGFFHRCGMRLLGRQQTRGVAVVNTMSRQGLFRLALSRDYNSEVAGSR